VATTGAAIADFGDGNLSPQSLPHFGHPSPGNYSGWVSARGGAADFAALCVARTRRSHAPTL